MSFASHLRPWVVLRSRLCFTPTSPLPSPYSPWLPVFSPQQRAVASHVAVLHRYPSWLPSPPWCLGHDRNRTSVTFCRALCRPLCPVWVPAPASLLRRWHRFSSTLSHPAVVEMLSVACSVSGFIISGAATSMSLTNVVGGHHSSLRRHFCPWYLGRWSVLVPVTCAGTQSIDDSVRWKCSKFSSAPHMISVFCALLPSCARGYPGSVSCIPLLFHWQPHSGRPLTMFQLEYRIYL